MKQFAIAALAVLFLASTATAEPARWIRGKVGDVNEGEGIIQIDDAYYALGDYSRKLPGKGTTVDVRLDPREDGLYVIEMTPVKSN